MKFSRSGSEIHDELDLRNVIVPFSGRMKYRVSGVQVGGWGDNVNGKDCGFRIGDFTAAVRSLGDLNDGVGLGVRRLGEE